LLFGKNLRKFSGRPSMSETDKAKKLAANLRAGSSDTWDLAGYLPAALEALVTSGLGQPIKCSEMLRFTFVVGGGKKVRQKYDDKLSQLFAEALKNGGFTEDRGAALSLECQGTFKQQHVRRCTADALPPVHQTDRS